MTKKFQQIAQEIGVGDVFHEYEAELAYDGQGWNSHDPVVAQWMRDARPDIVIDVGVWKGGSSIFFASVMKELEIDGAVIAIDTFLGSPEHWIVGRHGDFRSSLRIKRGQPRLYDQFLSNVKHAGLTDYIVPFPQTSANAARILGLCDIQADLIHVDAAHELAEVLSDARAYWPLLRSGGVLVGDDYNEEWPEVQQAARCFADEVGCPLVISEPKWFVTKP
ncbi:MAG TPA: class I SAM-dependent methyltransferase [Sphingobium sp.]